MRDISVYSLGNTEFEHDETACDYEIFDGDTPVATVTVYQNDPTFAYFLDEHGNMAVIPGLQANTAEDVLRLVKREIY